MSRSGEKNGLLQAKSNWIGSGRQLLLKRHGGIILKHLTLKKLGNISLNLLEYMFRKSNMTSAPIYMKIETTHFCHLRCPGCRHSSSRDTQMGFKDFKKVIDPFRDTLAGISFSHLGEPLWCEDLPEMIKYAHENNIGTMFPTNLSVPLSDEKAEELVNTGLELLMVSLDGTTSNTYREYRQGGKFDLILKNVRKISEAKIRMGKQSPDIQWKFTVFDHNAHEVDFVVNNYERLGFNSYSIEYDRGGKKSFAIKQRRSYEKSRKNNRRACYWPWNVMIVAWDGDVQPCCWTYKDYIEGYRTKIGNAIEDDSKDIWYGKNYSEFRSGFNKHKYGAMMSPVCKLCVGIED